MLDRKFRVRQTQARECRREMEYRGDRETKSEGKQRESEREAERKRKREREITSLALKRSGQFKET